MRLRGEFGTERRALGLRWRRVVVFNRGHNPTSRSGALHALEMYNLPTCGEVFVQMFMLSQVEVGVREKNSTVSVVTRDVHVDGNQLLHRCLPLVSKALLGVKWV